MRTVIMQKIDKKRHDLCSRRSGAVLRAAALLLACCFVLPLFGCRGPVIEIPEALAETAVPQSLVTAAPTEQPQTQPPEPTPEQTQHAAPAPGARRIYLTFDDGPNSATPQVLDILKQYNAKATFFTIGHCIMANPGTAKRIVNEGHLLACHTNSHDFGLIYTGPEAFVNDVGEWRATVEKYVGPDAGAFVYRFPGGSTNSSVGGRQGRGAYVEAMNEAGYIAMDWNLGLNDKWPAGNTEHLPMAEYLWKSYCDTWKLYGNIDPLIILIHDTVPESVELLPRVLDDLIARGLEFGLCDELNEDYLM